MSLVFVGAGGAVAALVLALVGRLRWLPVPRAVPPAWAGAVDALDRALRRRRIPVGAVPLLAVGAAAFLGGWLAGRAALGPGWSWPTAGLAAALGPLAWLRRARERRRAGFAAEMERLAAGLAGAVGAGMVPYEALMEVGTGLGGLLGPEVLRVVQDA